MSLNGSINLMKFEGAKKIIANGQKGIFIPVEDNPTISVSENGAFVNIRVWEREATFGERHYTHAIAASISKKKREELEKSGYSKEDIYALTPFIGNLEAREAAQNGGNFENAEVQEDDLPF